MPYAPGIQNISGQLAAQGIMAGGQAYGNAINSIGNSVVDFMKREDERAKTVGAIQGFLNDPFYQKQVAQDPTLSATGEKIKAGKASLNEVQQFLGSLTTAGHMRDQQMRQQQLDLDTQYKDALREQAIASAAATAAATKERERIQSQAVERAGLLKTIFAMNAPATEEGEAPAPVELSSNELFKQALAAGMTPDADTIRMFDKMGEYETAQSKLTQAAASAEQRAKIAELKAAAAQASAENRGDPVLLRLEQDLSNGRISQDDYNQYYRERMKILTTRKENPMETLADAITTLVHGGDTSGKGGGTSGTTKSAPANPTTANAAPVAPRTPASTRFVIQPVK